LVYDFQEAAERNAQIVSGGENLALSLEHDPTMDATSWNDCFGSEGYIYGEAPNSFLAEVTPNIPNGPVLCLAEGEGRNAVYLAFQGHHVTAVDQSEVGLTKAHRLAKARGVEVRTVIRDLQDYHITPGAWAGITAIFAHLPPVLRGKVHAEAALGLQPDGVLILEAYTPTQLARGTGGPKSPELLMTLNALGEELAGLDHLIAREFERDVLNGNGHTGRGAVVQILARRRA
jgi:hypothetical protein